MVDESNIVKLITNGVSRHLGSTKYSLHDIGTLDTFGEDISMLDRHMGFECVMLALTINGEPSAKGCSDFSNRVKLRSQTF